MQEDKIMLVSLLMAELGVHSVAYAFPKVKIITTAVDKSLDDLFHAVPGIGTQSHTFIFSICPVWSHFIQLELLIFLKVTKFSLITVTFRLINSLWSLRNSVLITNMDRNKQYYKPGYHHKFIYCNEKKKVHSLFIFKDFTYLEMIQIKPQVLILLSIIINIWN